MLATADDLHNAEPDTVKVINTWRPLRNADSSPLAIRSSGVNKATDRWNTGGDLQSFDMQRTWYWLPGMTHEDVFVFRQLDTAIGDPDGGRLAHVGVYRPEKANDPPRHSIETRSVVYKHRTRHVARDVPVQAFGPVPPPHILKRVA